MVLQSDSNIPVSHLSCGNCHLPIKDEDYDPSLLSLSKLQIESITNNRNRSNNEFRKINGKEYQGSNVLKQRLSTKKLSNIKNQNSLSNAGGKFVNDLKSSSYVLLEGANLSQNIDIYNNSSSNSILLLEDHALSRNVKALEPIFRILNESLDENNDGNLLSSIEHPLCKECCDILVNKLNNKYMDLLSEKEKYQEFLKRLEYHKQTLNNTRDRMSVMGKGADDTDESVKSLAYTISPKKKRLSVASPMTSPKKLRTPEATPNKSPSKKHSDSTLTADDLQKLKAIQNIEKETQSLITKLDELNEEADSLEVALQKEKLVLSKMKKEYMSKVNMLNNAKIIEYNDNLSAWSKLSSDMEKVHEDLAGLRNLNIYSTVFNISTSEGSPGLKGKENIQNNFGTINGLRIGYNWRETNAALGQVVLCLCNLSVPIKPSPHNDLINPMGIEWFPLGSVSKIVKQGIEYDCFFDPLDNSFVPNEMSPTDDNANNNNWNFLFFKHAGQQTKSKKDIRMSKQGLFNEAMVMIIQQINNLLVYYNHVKLEYISSKDPHKEDITQWTLPYLIHDEKINNVSIRYTNSNTSATSIEWVLSCKFMLVNLKYLMLYRHKLFLLGEEADDHADGNEES